MDINDRIEQLEFQQELLYENGALERYIYETHITRSQYNAIMKLMEHYRDKIDAHEAVDNATFEAEIYEIVPERKGDYHFCEMITQLFAEAQRWEEVFPALYGNMRKYGGSM